jgi:outer membrane protein OmpA-like peptidoglycan-associated protein
MKRSIAILFFAVAACLRVSAYNPGEEIRATLRGVELLDGSVRVSLRAEIGKRATRGAKTLMFVPVITDGTSRKALPAIVVQSHKARIADIRRGVEGRRQAMAPAYEKDAVNTTRGSSMSYNAMVDYEPWMEGADLEGEMLAMTCCSDKRFEDKVLLRKGLSLAKTETESTPAPAPAPARVAKYVYEQPASEKQPAGEQNYIVSFRQGRSQLDLWYGNNARVLGDMVMSIDAAGQSPEGMARRIMVTGYASPEGPFSMNDLLARERAEAVRRYILDNTGLPGHDVYTHNGSENWEGLKAEVERSAMLWREEVLWIIGDPSYNDAGSSAGRKSELKKLGGGGPYRYMSETFFPRLRSAVYVKIYYETK